jgi:phosphonate transport system substrate-binding protein
MKKRSLLTALAAFFVCHITFAKIYTFAIPEHAWQTGMTNAQIVEHYRPLKNYLEKSTGMQFKLVGFFNDAPVINKLATGQYDIVYTKIFPYLLAKKKNPNVTPLVTVLTWNNNHTQKKLSYTGYILTKKSNKNINSLRDLKGKSIGFIDRFSASGFLYPVAIMNTLGIHYKTFFKHYRFYDTHLKALQALANNQVDAAAIWGSQWKMFKNKQLFKALLVIPNIPNPSIVASADLSNTQKQKITTALIHAPAAVFNHLFFAGFVKTPAYFYRRFQSLSDVSQFIKKPD